MGKPNYLVQERDGEEQYLYAWTPVLAAKENMRPITDKEADEIRKNQKLKAEGRFDHKVDDLEEIEPEDYELDEDNAVLDSIKPGADKVSDVDGEARPLVVTQQDIYVEEADVINSLHSKNAVEEYILTKYRLPMLQMDELDDFKEQAVEILSTLADANSLHK